MPKHPTTRNHSRFTPSERVALLDRITPRRDLASRISDPPPPLIERISSPENPTDLNSEINEEQVLAELGIRSIPHNLHFRTKKTTNRVKDFNKKCSAVAVRIEPFYALLQRKPDAFPSQVHADLVEIGNRFDNFYHNLEEIAGRKKDTRVRASVWKRIDEDLKSIGRVSFTGLKKRFVEIGLELAALKTATFLVVDEQH